MITFAVVSIQTQKIDARLISLLPTDEKAMNAKGTMPVQPIDTRAVKNDINVTLNSDCTVRSFSAIAMVKEGCIFSTILHPEAVCQEHRQQQAG